MSTATIRKHTAALSPTAAAAVAKEATHTARLAREDGADTAAGQSRLARALGRATTPAEQIALERCVRTLLDADEAS